METLWIEILLKSVFSHQENNISLHRPQAIALSTVPLPFVQSYNGQQIYWSNTSEPTFLIFYFMT